MGLTQSKSFNDPPKGCWWPEAEPAINDHVPFQEEGIPAAAFWLDCDCVALKNCPFAPPPLPPLEHFMARDIVAGIHGHVDDYGGHVKDDENVDDAGGGGDDGNVDDAGSPAPSKPRSDGASDDYDKKYGIAVVEMLEALTTHKRFGLEELSKNFDPNHKAIDTEQFMQRRNANSTSPPWPTVMGIMLANPRDEAEMMVSLIDEVKARNLMRCTEHALDAAVSATFKLPGGGLDRELVVGDHPKIGGRLGLQGKLHLVVKDVRTAWKKNPPVWVRPREANGTMTEDDIKEENAQFDQVCDALWPLIYTASNRCRVESLANECFLAEWKTIWFELGRFTPHAKHRIVDNYFANKINLAQIAANADMSWTNRKQQHAGSDFKTSRLEKNLAEAFATWKVAFDYLALSLHTGSWIVGPERVKGDGPEDKLVERG